MIKQLACFAVAVAVLVIGCADRADAQCFGRPQFIQPQFVQSQCFGGFQPQFQQFQVPVQSFVVPQTVVQPRFFQSSFAFQQPQFVNFQPRFVRSQFVRQPVFFNNGGFNFIDPFQFRATPLRGLFGFGPRAFARQFNRAQFRRLRFVF